jgi:NAD(P)H-hydrate epimerase
LIGEAVRADLTVTFTAPKPANVLPPAAHLNGQLVVANIGSPQALLEASPSRLFLAESADARAWLEKTRYTPDSYKNTHGHALIIAGSRNYTGAAVLCGNAAMSSGAGLVTVATPASALPSVAARVMPEVMTAALAETPAGSAALAALSDILKLAERSTVIAIGPGLASDAEETRRLVRAVVEERRRAPVVIDADGLNALAPWPADLRGTPEAPLILTPHAGEMLRLLGSDDRAALDERVRVASDFAAAHQLILVLKGTRALIAAPDGRVYINPTGNAGLGTGGSGDTLTGIITGFVAQAFATLGDQADAVEATVAAVLLSGMAGDIAARERGMRTLVASDIRGHLSDAVLALDAKGERP